jgi:hypothetical protein
MNEDIMPIVKKVYNLEFFNKIFNCRFTLGTTQCFDLTKINGLFSFSETLIKLMVRDSAFSFS